MSHFNLCPKVAISQFAFFRETRTLKSVGFYIFQYFSILFLEDQRRTKFALNLLSKTVFGQILNFPGEISEFGSQTHSLKGPGGGGVRGRFSLFVCF